MPQKIKGMRKLDETSSQLLTRVHRILNLVEFVALLLLIFTDLASRLHEQQSGKTERRIKHSVRRNRESLHRTVSDTVKYVHTTFS